MSSEALVAQLREVLPDASPAHLQRLVVASHGSLERALHIHFTAPSHSPASSPAPRRPARVEETIDDDDEPPPSSPPALSAEERIDAEAEDDTNDDDRPSSPISPRPPSSSSSSPLPSPRKLRPASSKRKPASGSGSGGGSGGAKKRRVQRPRDQRSIASFFTGGPPSSQPAVRIPPFPSQVVDALPSPQPRTLIGSFTSPSPNPAPAQPPSTSVASPDPPTTGTGDGPPSGGSAVTPMASSVAASATFTSVPPLTLATGPPCWCPPAPVPYLHLARTFRAIEAETGRILITNLLSLMLWRILDLSPLDLLPSTFLSLNHLAPPFENLQLHVGGALMSRVIREATGRSRQQMRDDFIRLGDLGDVAQLYRVTQPMLVRPAELTAREVYSRIYGLSRMVGSGMGRKKEEVVKRLLIACREYETTYIVRSVLQDMRIGGAITTVLAALAKAVVLHAHHSSKGSSREDGTVATWERVVQATQKDCASPLLSHADTVPALLSHPAIAALPTASLQALIRTATTTLRHCYSQHPNLRSIISHLLSHPLSIFTLLSAVHLESGTPCKPMLGKIAKGLHALLKRLRGEAFSCEIKYDGLRAQIHLMRDGTYRLFSRHLMEQTERWRDLWPLLDRARRKGDKGKDDAGHEVEVRSFILDAELVAVELSHDDGGALQSFRILPFQAVTTRKRKVDGRPVDATRVEVTVLVYAFDLLHLNEQPLLQRPLSERRALLRSHFVEVPGGVQLVEHIDISKEESECIAVVEEDDEVDDSTAQHSKRPASKKANGDEEGANDDDESGSEEEAEVASEAVSDEDAVFQQKSKAGKRSPPPHLEADDDVPAIEALPTRPPPPSAPAKVKGATLDALSDEQVEMGAAAYNRILRFLYDRAIVQGEGLMAKSLSPLSTYEPDVRTDQWVKCKSDYIAGLSVGDSLDVVPIGGWWGNGRKVGWYSPVLLAVYNPETECLESLCKVMNGFSDVLYAELVKSFAPRVIPRPKPYYVVDDELTPSVWFDADRVWEIRGADLTLSPRHSAARGLVHESRGISLRFPRFIRQREDKAVEDATTSQQIAELFQRQSRKGNSGGRGQR